MDMYYSDISNGPIRKYYSITDLGKAHLEEYISLWKYIEEVFSKIGIL